MKYYHLRVPLGGIVVNSTIMLYSLIPVLWIASLSLKPAAFVQDGSFIPRHISWENYKHIFHDPNFFAAFINSLGIVLLSTVIAVCLAMCAAYALARIRFRGKFFALIVIFLVSIFPQISLVTPLFNIERKVGLFDTWPGLIIPYVTFGLPLAVFTLVSYFSQLPHDLERAAVMDGATMWHILRSIIFPIAIPGIVTAAILVFISTWNDLLFAMSLTATNHSQTAPVAIVNFTGSNEFEVPTGSIAAGAIVITIPMLLFVILFQRKIITGLTSGAVKG